MTEQQKLAFFDELSEIEKVSGFMQNVGMKARQVASGLGQDAKSLGRYAVTAGDQAGRAAGSFLSPQQSATHGLDHMLTGFRSAGLPGKVLQTYSFVNDFRDALPRQDPTGAGRSQLHRYARAFGGQFGGLMGAPHGLAGSLAGVSIGNRLGDAAGRVVDKIRRYRRPEPQPVQGY